MDGIEYQEIPNILSKYDVRMVLYKATTLTCMYSIPNKVYEYLVCGLNVWYPKEMLEMSNSQEPKKIPVFKLNFENNLLSELGEVDRNLVKEFTSEISNRPLILDLTT